MAAPPELEGLFAQLGAPPAELAAMVEGLIRSTQEHQGDERRSAPRYPLACPVVVVPIDEAWTAKQAFAAITRDVSARGIAIYHTEPVYEPYLAIQWITDSGEKLRVLVEVVRCRPVGPFFFEIAGTFVTQQDV